MLSRAIIRRSVSVHQWQRRQCIHSTPSTYVGIGTVAENKIAEWLHNGGDEAIGTNHRGKKLPSDHHGNLSRTLGVHNDYVHSKILADNSIKPESVERRLALDAAWDELKGEIRRAHADYCKNGGVEGSHESVREFVASDEIMRRFGDEIKKLDRMAKRVNDAIISDSLRFNGRSPVRHARRFDFEARMREAIIEEVEESADS